MPVPRRISSLCAELVGMRSIVHPYHLEELIAQYENSGHFKEPTSLLDSGLSHERSHVGKYTEPDILYAKYKPEKLLDFIKLSTPKLNTVAPQVDHARVRATEAGADAALARFGTTGECHHCTIRRCINAEWHYGHGKSPC